MDPPLLQTLSDETLNKFPSPYDLADGGMLIPSLLTQQRKFQVQLS